MNTLGRARKRFHKKLTGWYAIGRIPRCVYCGVVFATREGITMDHYVPIANGGSNDVDNLVPSCYSCNKKKGKLMIKKKYNDWIKYGF